MEYKLMEEKRELKEKANAYYTMCKILLVVILIMGIIWYITDNGRIKAIEKLKDQIAEQEEQIEELESTIKYLHEEYGQ